MIVKGSNLSEPYNSVITYILRYTQYSLLTKKYKYETTNK